MARRDGELTIDELAASAGMTVRNVRAYASRGLIPAPRLVGRTGFYAREVGHRLKLIRDLIGRGYSLTAVTKALESGPVVPDAGALDLLSVLGNPLGADEEPEELAVHELARLAGVEPDAEFIDRLVEGGLLRRLPGDRVELLRPQLVRAGASALALGLERDSVFELLDAVEEAMSSVARAFVATFLEQKWRPFLEAGMPEEEWPRMLAMIESLLPVAGQVVVAVFRDQMADAIGEALGEQLNELTGEQVERLLPGS